MNGSMDESMQKLYRSSVETDSDSIRKVYAIALLLVGNEARADQLAVDTFAETYRRAAYRKPKSPDEETLIRKLARLFLNRVRFLKGGAPPGPENNTADNVPVRRAILKLGPVERLAVVLFLLRRSAKEKLADLMGVDIETAQRALRRGRYQLSAELKPRVLQILNATDGEVDLKALTHWGNS